MLFKVRQCRCDDSVRLRRTEIHACRLVRLKILSVFSVLFQ